MHSEWNIHNRRRVSRNGKESDVTFPPSHGTSCRRRQLRKHYVMGRTDGGQISPSSDNDDGKENEFHFQESNLHRRCICWIDYRIWEWIFVKNLSTSPRSWDGLDMSYALARPTSSYTLHSCLIYFSHLNASVTLSGRTGNGRQRCLSSARPPALRTVSKSTRL